MKRLLKWLIPILVLPGTVLVLVPAAILLTTRPVEWAGPGEPLFWLGVVCGAAGLALGLWTMALYRSEGGGTPAPWDPPRRLVVAGPYRHLRHPMITGVFLMLAAEALLARSPGIFVWLAVFLTGNLIYLPLMEEKRLERRFGSAYRVYKENVPRWVPRLRPWTPPQD